MKQIPLTANHFKIRKQEKVESSLETEILKIEAAINQHFSKEMLDNISIALDFLSEYSKTKIKEIFEPRGFEVIFIQKEKDPSYTTTIKLCINN